MNWYTSQCSQALQLSLQSFCDFILFMRAAPTAVAIPVSMDNPPCTVLKKLLQLIHLCFLSCAILSNNVSPDKEACGLLLCYCCSSSVFVLFTRLASSTLLPVFTSRCKPVKHNGSPDDKF